ncbi:DUF6069 family protein [Micromonospora avicenniae]|uniref:DUF6069 family protein n=1 Tax=Micromonospora avicenniae TaxID=1198245 RepID=UPI001FE2C77A|nr:DUF6069 family protein [Micromonospora avicenniae]
MGVVTRGQVQLELRDGEPGPVLERGAGFWLRGTGVRALRNPGPGVGASIPLPGFAVVTGFFSLVGIVIAAALLRWSARPAKRFLWSPAVGRASPDGPEQ